MKRILPFLWGLALLVFCGLVIWAIVPHGGDENSSTPSAGWDAGACTALSQVMDLANGCCLGDQVDCQYYRQARDAFGGLTGGNACDDFSWTIRTYNDHCP